MDCGAYFEDAVSLSGADVKVYRCDWGWFVRAGALEARSRYLDEAFEQLLGHRLDRDGLRTLIRTLDRELTAEHDRTGRTASRTLGAA